MPIKLPKEPSVIEIINKECEDEGLTARLYDKQFNRERITNEIAKHYPRFVYLLKPFLQVITLAVSIATLIATIISIIII